MPARKSPKSHSFSGSWQKLEVRPSYIAGSRSQLVMRRQLGSAGVREGWGEATARPSCPETLWPGDPGGRPPDHDDRTARTGCVHFVFRFGPIGTVNATVGPTV